MTLVHVLGTLGVLIVITWIWLRSRRRDPPVD
jgi:hypothetical protein